MPSGRGRRDFFEKRIQAINSEKPLTSDPAVIEPAQMLVATLLPQLRAFYESQRAKGSSHNAAIRALAFKWIRVLDRCWVDRVPYDESRYLAALQKRHSPILKFAAQESS